MDLQSRVRWEDYTKAKEIMFEKTHIPEAEWHVVPAIDKKLARLNCIAHLLTQVPYQEIKTEKQKEVIKKRTFKSPLFYYLQCVPKLLGLIIKLFVSMLLSSYTARILARASSAFSGIVNVMIEGPAPDNAAAPN